MRTPVIIMGRLFAVVALTICAGEWSCLFAEELPGIEVLVEKAELRERLFDGLDVTFRCGIYNPDREDPIYEGSCRWVKDNERKFIDYEQQKYSESEQEIYRHIKLGFDGQIARTLFAHTMKGKVFTDIQKDIIRGHYYGPDIIGITLPMAMGVQVSDLLKGTPLISSNLKKTVNRHVKIIGNEDIDMVRCILVEVALDESEDFKSLTRLYLAEEYDYAVYQAEHSYIKNGVERLGSRIRMDNFCELKEGLWYPASAEYEVFQGEDKPRQTTIFEADKISWPEKFDDDLFKIDFPPGTHVFDAIVGIDYVAGGGYIENMHMDGGGFFQVDQIDISSAEEIDLKNTEGKSADIGKNVVKTKNTKEQVQAAGHQEADLPAVKTLESEISIEKEGNTLEEWAFPSLINIILTSGCLIAIFVIGFRIIRHTN